MSGKLSRELRKIAEFNTVGMAKDQTRRFYKGLKKAYKGMSKI